MVFLRKKLTINLLCVIIMFQSVLGSEAKRLLTTNKNLNLYHNLKTRAATVERPCIKIKNGDVVIGNVNKTDLNTTYHSFRGIPYAMPPIGDLRFKPPVPLSKKQSNGTIYAYDDGPICTQTMLPSIAAGSEDCLTLNIYVPQISGNSDKLPVMVWIYGGGFAVGDSTYARYGPDYFLDENVMFVSFNYRVGIFGFLSTEDKASPGNYALRDQILALEWIKDNIEFFGGNSSDVTLFGESAGSVCVSILTQTPFAEGLFHKAILESGTSLNLWGLSRYPKTVAHIIAERLGIKTDNTTELVDRLRKVNAAKLHAVTVGTFAKEILHQNILDGLPIGPVLEPPNADAVYTNKSYEQLSKGCYHRIPYLMGYNSLEAIPFIEGVNNARPLLIKYDLEPTALVPDSMNIVENLTAVTVNHIIKSRYFGITPITISENSLLQFVSDDQFTRPIRAAAHFYSQNAPLYFYVFSYEGPTDEFYRKTTSRAKGVGHGDELLFLFKRDPANSVKPSADDLLTRKRLIKLWTNFAKTSNPTPVIDPLFENLKWPLAAVDSKNFTIKYLNIDKKLSVKSNPNSKSFRFWWNLFQKYGDPPYSTF